MPHRYSARRCSSTSSKLGGAALSKERMFKPSLALLSILILGACADSIPVLMASPDGSLPAARSSDATGTARAEVTAKQLAGINAPPPESLIGKAGSDLVALLGEPGLVHKEKDGEVWQYAASACVMLFYLYDNSAGARRVTYLEALPQSSSGVSSTVGDSPQTCLAFQMLAASGRPLS